MAPRLYWGHRWLSDPIGRGDTRYGVDTALVELGFGERDTATALNRAPSALYLVRRRGEAFRLCIEPGDHVRAMESIIGGARVITLRAAEDGAASGRRRGGVLPRSGRAYWSGIAADATVVGNGDRVQVTLRNLADWSASGPQAGVTPSVGVAPGPGPTSTVAWRTLPQAELLRWAWEMLAPLGAAPPTFAGALATDARTLLARFVEVVARAGFGRVDGAALDAGELRFEVTPWSRFGCAFRRGFTPAEGRDEGSMREALIEDVLKLVVFRDVCVALDGSPTWLVLRDEGPPGGWCGWIEVDPAERRRLFDLWREGDLVAAATVRGTFVGPTPALPWSGRMMATGIQRGGWGTVSLRGSEAEVTFAPRRQSPAPDSSSG